MDMKKYYLFLILIAAQISLFAQAPEGINYQAVARDLTGAEIPNTLLAVQQQQQKHETAPVQPKEVIKPLK